jgi:hypothetical protein
MLPSRRRRQRHKPVMASSLPICWPRSTIYSILDLVVTLLTLSGGCAPLPEQRPCTFLSGDGRSSSSASFPPQHLEST